MENQMNDLYTMSFEQQIKTAYDDWVALLEHTGKTDMLKDPYQVWLEAYHVATLLARSQG
jgi:hypothetical protein